MSIPVAVAAASGREGVLVKGGAQLEALGRICVVAFDGGGHEHQDLDPHLALLEQLLEEALAREVEPSPVAQDQRWGHGSRDPLVSPHPVM